MVKFVITADLHYQGSNPRGRTDDYPAAIEAKVREVFQIADEEHAAAILIAGDLFNSPGVSRPTFRRLFWLLKESPCEILTIHGSPDHDGLDASIEQTWYQLLVDAGIIQDVQATPWYSSPIAPMAMVTGRGANPRTDHDLTDYLLPDWIDDRHPSRVQIHMAHGMLLERAPGEHCPFRYTTLDQVAAHDRAPDVLICGHYHPGWGIKKIGRTLFINPGALARTSAAISEFERPAQVAVLEIGDDTVDARLVPLRSARPGHEVLSREHLEAAALREQRTAEFLAVLAAQDELKRLEISEIVDRIAQAEGLPEAVRMEALRRIDEQRARKAAG